MAAKKDGFSVKKITRKLGREGRAQNSKDQPSNSHDLVEQMEFLYVQLIQVINTPKTCTPIVEVALGNHKSSTKDLPLGPSMEWNQVFAFDKTKDDVLSINLSLDESENGVVVVGEQNFKLAEDIPSRVPPDSRIVPKWYSMNYAEDGHPVMLLMSVWFGTQADEVYSHAWFSDSFDVSASCLINTRPNVYLAPRLCYVRVKVVSGHDLVSNDGNRTPSVYVKATLGKQVQKTAISSGSNPSWNQELIFVASEPLHDIVYISLIDHIDDQQEECIGTLTKYLSEMYAVKVPESAPWSIFYDIKPSVEGDSRQFSSKIKMKLTVDQTYHVFDEYSQYSSDYQAFAKGLWPALLGKLEIGILGATGLETVKDLGDGTKTSTDAYVVAKYGNKWAKTRTVADSFSPKWNEQYTWDVYDKCTVVTLGIYDNYSRIDYAKDVPIGKVRIPLISLEWDKLYTRSFPIILDLGETELKKTRELHLAVRCVPLAQPVALAKSRFGWTLPRAHYISRLSTDQTEQLREEAVKVNCVNLAKAEPPLRNEVVADMLKPPNRDLVSIRICKANYESLCRMVQTLSMWYAWFDANIRLTTDVLPKFVAVYICGLLLFFPKWIMCLAVYILPVYVASKFLSETIKRGYYRNMYGIDTPPPLVLEDDLKLENLAEKVVTFIGEAASWVERLCLLFTSRDDPFALAYSWVVLYLILLAICNVPYQILGFFG
ncbi:hypothetical protein AALP_AA5G165300 [Arabis alpina]|uniref:C2 domain-containing protein n=1 Tax=Arabis alpina TaxID=50452 RepID=A0A087GXI5_ARAAL|nr:hypothetical protein AALP_AA5G165300 [Arabis alpina]